MLKCKIYARNKFDIPCILKLSGNQDHTHIYNIYTHNYICSFVIHTDVCSQSVIHNSQSHAVLMFMHVPDSFSLLSVLVS